MRTYALLALLLLQFHVNGQSVSSSVVNSTGSSYAQGYYNIEWSVGELAIVNTLQSQDGKLVVSSGFLQPDQPQQHLSHHFTPDEIKILPNPTYSKLELNISTRQQGVLRIQLFDAGGKSLKTAQLASSGVASIERIDMINYPSGTYVVRIDLDPAPGSVRKTGSYKIIKL